MRSCAYYPTWRSRFKASMQVSTSQSRLFTKVNYLPFIIEFTRRVSRTVLTFWQMPFYKIWLANQWCGVGGSVTGAVGMSIPKRGDSHAQTAIMTNATTVSSSIHLVVATVSWLRLQFLDSSYKKLTAKLRIWRWRPWDKHRYVWVYRWAAPGSREVEVANCNLEEDLRNRGKEQRGNGSWGKQTCSCLYLDIY